MANFFVDDGNQQHQMLISPWNEGSNPPAHVHWIKSDRGVMEAGWNWPTARPDGVTWGFYLITHGVPSKDPAFPITLNQRSHLTLTVPDLHCETMGGFAVAFDTYTFKAGTTDWKVMDELFVILKHQNYNAPPQIDSFTDSFGVTWNYGVWSSNPTNNIFWKQESPNNSLEKIDYYDFFRHVNVDLSNFINEVQLGVEPLQGQGLFRVNGFSVT